MSIFVDENTKVIVQGLTGGQGRFHGLRNRDYGTKVVAGVTPGKGGQFFEHGTHRVPIFNSVADAAKATGATKRPYVRRTSTRPPAMDMLTGNPVTPAEDNLLHRLSDADIAVVNFWIKNGNYIASPTSPSYDTPLT